MICIQNLNFSYAYNEPILKNLSLDIADGEYIAIIGANGSGKTSFIRHLNGLLIPSKGEVLVDGLSTRNPKNLPEIRCLVGMIFQNPDNQMIGMSVEEDVAFGPENLGLASANIRKRVDEALEIVGLTDYRTRPPHTLSGGQKQLLALAGVLAMNSKFIVLDEPTSSLDPESNHKVLTLLQELNNRGIGIIHVTHNMDDITNVDRVLVMDQGKLIADGSAGDILNRVEWLKTLGLAPPKIADLMWYLRQRGEDVAEGILTVGKAGEEIISLLTTNRNLINAARIGR